MTRADAGDGRRTPERKRVTDARGEGACPLWHERRGGPAPETAGRAGDGQKKSPDVRGRGGRREREAVG